MEEAARLASVNRNFFPGRYANKDGTNALNKEALTDSNEIWVRFNYALGLLAAGEIQKSKTEYAAALKHAADPVAATRAQGKEVSPAVWFQFDDGAKDLQALLTCASQQACTGAPSYSVLKNPDDIAPVAQELITTLKENSVALEYTGKPPAGSANVTIEPFQFSRHVLYACHFSLRSK